MGKLKLVETEIEPKIGFYIVEDLKSNSNSRTVVQVCSTKINDIEKKFWISSNNVTCDISMAEAKKRFKFIAKINLEHLGSYTLFP